MRLVGHGHHGSDTPLIRVSFRVASVTVAATHPSRSTGSGPPSVPQCPSGTPCQTQGSGVAPRHDHTRRVGREPPRGSHGGRRRHGTARGHRAAAIEPRPGRADRTAGGLADCHAARRRRPPHPRPRGHVGQRHVERDAAVRRRRGPRAAPPADHRLVARVAPDADDVPVFPRYDLPGQFEVIRLVGELTDVPVPHGVVVRARPRRPGRAVLRHEPRRRARPARRHAVQLRRQLALRRRRPPTSAACRTPPSTSSPASTPSTGRRAVRVPRPRRPRRHAAAPPGGRSTRAWYEFAAADGFASPLVERGFAWLDDHWPDRRGRRGAELGRLPDRQHDVPTGSTPVAVLDWEMAGARPARARRGLADLRPPHLRGHRRAIGPGGHARLPAPRRRRRRATSALTGHTPARPRLVRHATPPLQYAIVFLRTGARSVHFGEVEPPADVDDLIMNRDAARAHARRHVLDADPCSPSRSTSTRSTRRRCRCATSGSSDRNFYDRCLLQRPRPHRRHLPRHRPRRLPEPRRHRRLRHRAARRPAVDDPLLRRARPRPPRPRRRPLPRRGAWSRSSASG